MIDEACFTRSQEAGDNYYWYFGFYWQNKCTVKIKLITHYLGYLINSGLKKYEAGACLWHYQYADIEGALDVVQNIH